MTTAPEMTTLPVATAISAAAARLEAAGVESAQHDAEELAAHLLGLRRGGLALVEGLELDAAAAYELLVARRERREPLQHITGVAGFRYLDIAVGPGALVPRPETELVAGAAIDAARLVVGHPALVVDLGTGTGAIALAVASEVPGAVVHAVDVDPAALVWAARNVAATGCSVALHQSAAAEALPELDGTVDVVVSNPPYLPAGTTIGAEVEHDPAVALWGGPDGLTVVREVVAAAERLLRPGGVLVLEHDASHGEAVRLLLAESPSWTDERTHRDLTGRDRFVVATHVTAGRTP